MKKSFKIFTGSSSHLLGQKVAKKLGVKLGQAEITRFADGECRVRIEEEVKSGTIFVLHSTCPPVDENLMELCLLGDTLKRNEAKKLVAIVPYLGYSRQDKVHRKGECLSAAFAAKMIELSGFDELITFDVHSEKALHFFKIPTQNLSAVPVLCEAMRALLHAKGKTTDWAIVAPDKGAMSRARELAKNLGASAVFIEKERDLLTGRLKIKGVKGEIAGKNLVICDDMITSGGTLVLAADFLKRQKAAQILACATHPLLVKSASEDLQRSSIKEVIVTDAIPLPKEKCFPKLQIVSVAPLVASVILSSV